ncbi:uncharacterized protein METZ01_LOCUS152519 [marine metagenome]|uniref:Uncharacterized protein n=1 Tax=marine metagenome TaxID=408172 RepID=A0A382ADN1_9ZZZZ
MTDPFGPPLPALAALATLYQEPLLLQPLPEGGIKAVTGRNRLR